MNSGPFPPDDDVAVAPTVLFSADIRGTEANFPDVPADAVSDTSKASHPLAGRGRREGEGEPLAVARGLDGGVFTKS